VADPLNRILPPTTIDRAIPVDRERDKDKESDRQRGKVKRAGGDNSPESSEEEPADDQTPPLDPTKGHGVDIKV
jgi:hypothetical protein